ncbi:hypothetical protein AB0F91_11700 [Amycolatopsis sp. NPDC023774]|uniref:hypothetical protein n=1 Tax=Amycolatopsis sp. NPDC023774 TaxID=3155015 RepID=UPI0033E0A9E6
MVTNLGVLEFGGADHAPRLLSVHRGVSVEDVTAATSSPLDTSGTARARAPGDDELRLPREVPGPKVPARQGSPS